MGSVKGEGSLYFGTGIDNSGLKAGSSEAVGIVKGMSKNISKINPFAALAIAAVASMAIISKAAYDMAQEFETAMKEVETISSATQKNYQDISKSVFALSKVSTDKPAALAKAYYQIVSAGYDGAKGLELLAVSTKAAIGGITDTETAADGLTTVLNAFKLEATESEHVADILFQTVKLGKTTFSELAANMSTVAPIAAASGVSFEQVAAAIATLTKSGVPTAQAMTQIRSAIIGTNEALGDGWSQTMTLQEAFQLLYEKAGGSQTALQGLVGRVEAVGGVLGVAGINAATAAADLEAMGVAAGSSQKAFDTMINTNANQWKLFGNNLRSTIKGIGDSLLDMSSGIARGLNSLFQENESVVDSLKKHRTAIIDLTFEYKDTNTTAKRRIEILGELKELNPAIVSGLGTEEDKYILLNNQLESYNVYLSTRIRLEKELEALNKLKAKESGFREAIVDLESRAGNLIQDLFSKVNDGSQLISKEAQEEFNKIIQTSYDSNIEKLKELGDLLKNQGGKIGEVVFASTTGGFAISAAEESLNRYRKTVAGTLNDINAAQEEINQKLLIAIKIDKNQIENVRTLLVEYQDLQKVSDAIGVDVTLIDVPEIQKEIEKIKEVAAEIENINKITKADYKKDPNSLSVYLESENEQIKEAAEKREAYLTGRGRGGGPKVEPLNFEDFKKSLDEQQKYYENYTKAVINGDKNLADEIKKTYKLKKETYLDYLAGLYDSTKSYEEKSAILTEAREAPQIEPLKVQEFKESLDKQQKYYEDYTQAIINGDTQLAQELSEKHEFKSDNYLDYLAELYDSTKEHDEKMAILSEAREVPISGEIGGGGDAEPVNITAFRQSLEAQKTAYDDYTRAVLDGDTQLAQNISQNQDFKKQSYLEYLYDIQDAVQDHDKKMVVFQEIARVQPINTEEFKQTLQEQREYYEAYNQAILDGDADLAQDIAKNLDLKTTNYLDYLSNLRESTQSHEEEMAAFKLIAENQPIDIAEFLKNLEAKREAYEAYNLAIKSGDDEFAETIAKRYDLQRATYADYLNGMYVDAVDFRQKLLLLQALESEDADLRPKDLKPIDTTDLVLGRVEISDDYVQSLDSLNAQLQKLEDEYRASTSERDKIAIAEKIGLKKKQIEDEEALLDKHSSWIDDLERQITGYSRRELKLRLKNLKKELDDELKLHGKHSDEVIELEGKIKETRDELGDRTQQTINEVTGVLDEASELFAKFGNEEIAGLLSQLSDVAAGVGTLATGIATGNPLAIIQGSLEILNAAITVEIVSDTAKFEAEIDRLSTVLNRLSRDIDDAIGLDKIDTRLDALREESALMQANKNALQAELEARKEIKLLGITVGSKGSGSGTDAEKIKEFEDAIDELEHKLTRLQQEIYETLTATTASSITDSIIQGFEDGKSSITDFAGTFEDTIKKAIVESFKLKYLEQASQDFFDLFGEYSQTDNTLSVAEINNLRDAFGNLISDSESELAALNDILGGAGIEGGLFGDAPDAAGLSGDIRRNITEETGTELAGLMRRIADDVSFGLAAGREAVDNLILIQANTFNTVNELQNVIVRLDSIEDNTRQSLLHDLGN